MQNLSLGSLYMLYDRTYMQSPRELFKRSFCDQLIIFLISCFVLQAVLSLFFGSPLVNNFVGFGYNNLTKGYFWTIITYASVHDGPLHLILNLLGIHFIGRPVEDFIGNRKFKYLVLSSVLLGAVIWILFNKFEYQYLVGSSAIVLACLCTFCLFQPNRVNFGENVSIKEETDRILDKINDKGFGSLTESEKETLEKAKKLLGKE